MTGQVGRRRGTRLGRARCAAVLVGSISIGLIGAVVNGCSSDSEDGGSGGSSGSAGGAAGSGASNGAGGSGGAFSLTTFHGVIVQQPTTGSPIGGLVTVSFDHPIPFGEDGQPTGSDTITTSGILRMPDDSTIPLEVVLDEHRPSLSVKFARGGENFHWSADGCYGLCSGGDFSSSPPHYNWAIYEVPESKVSFHCATYHPTTGTDTRLYVHVSDGHPAYCYWNNDKAVGSGFSQTGGATVECKIDDSTKVEFAIGEKKWLTPQSGNVLVDSGSPNGCAFP